MNLTGAVELAQIGAYGLASGLYLGFHLGVGQNAARWARRIFFAGFLVQLVDIGARCFALRHPLSSTPEAVSFVAFLIAGGFLLASGSRRLAATGAFAAPTVLVLVVLARVVPDGGTGAPAGPLAAAHVLLATLGEALFALAAVAATLYLVQERRLKRKDFSRTDGHAAPLETLDRLSARCVSVGFPVFTLAIVTGAVMVARMGILRSSSLRPEYVLAVVSWIAYGILLGARRGAGWQGRRAAWITLGGFAGALLVLLGYFLRHIV